MKFRHELIITPLVIPAQAGILSNCQTFPLRVKVNLTHGQSLRRLRISHRLQNHRPDLRFNGRVLRQMGEQIFADN